MTYNFSVRLLRLFPVLLLLVSLPAFAQKKDSYQGLLWEVSGNGLSHPSYLYGTMHVSNKLAFHLTDSFFHALKSVDIVGLETNPASWMEKFIETGMVNQYSGYYGMDGAENFYESAFNIPVPGREELAGLFSGPGDNGLINGMLYRFSPGQADYQENTFLDLFIFQAARKSGKPVVNLEGFEESMRLYREAIKAQREEKTDYDPSARYRMMREGKNPQDLLEDAYRRGDLDLLDSLQALMTPSKAFRRYFLDARNIVMANSMDSVMRNRPLFAAVGAAHLPGDTGMISILRRMGYTVRPVSGNVSRGSIQEREKIEQSRFPLSYAMQYAPDSSFRQIMPGKWYDLTSSASPSSVSYYFYPDMVNSSFFTVSRLSTFNALTGMSQEEVMMRIDSLLYENVPGKIIQKKRIKSNNGWPGFDIISKTRRGDLIRYNAFVSPQEVIVFTVGGNGDFAKQKDVTRFFSSIEFLSGATSANGSWRTFKGPHGGYQIEVPNGYVYHHDASENLQMAKNEQIQAYAQAEGTHYIFMRSSLYDFDYIEEDSFELGYLTTKFAEKNKYELAESKLLQLEGRPVLESKLKSDKGEWMHMRTVIDGPHYYLLAALRKDEVYPERFFKSFRFEAPKYDTAFTLEEDTIFNCFVTLAQPMDEGEMFYRSMRNATSGEEDNSHLADNGGQFYYSPSTSEAIGVWYNKFHKYFQPTEADSFWQQQAEALSAYPSFMNVSRFKMKKEGDIETMDMLLTDTGSTRGLLTRQILKGGIVYTIQTLIDTNRGPSPWATQFFEQFRLSDTTIGQSIYASKTQAWFEDLTSSDSTRRAQARNSVGYVNFEDKDGPKVMDFIKSPAYRELKLSERVNLVSKLGQVHHPQTVSVLKDIYSKAGDTATIQLAVLGALADLKTPEAARTFASLIVKETPISAYSYGMSNIFMPFYDSLPLMKELYPSVLQLTRYPEYSEMVYDMLATLVDSGQASPKLYASHRNTLLDEAKMELKRQKSRDVLRNSREEDEEEYYGYSDNSGNTTLRNYTVLLLPWHKEADVKPYFERLQTIQDPGVKLATSLLMLRNNMPVSDTVWMWFAKNDHFRLDLYEGLQEIKRLDKYDTSYSNQLDIARSALYQNRFKPSKDTAVFLSSETVSSRRGLSEVYFFKSKEKDSKHWKLDYVVYPKNEEDSLYTKPWTLMRGSSYGTMPVDTETQLGEQKKEVLEGIAMWGRLRVSGEYGYTEDYEVYEEY